MNDQKLPLQTPDGLATLYSSHPGLKGVGLNSWTAAYAASVKFWWVSFRSLEALHKFVQEVDGSVYDDVTFRITIDFKQPTSTKALQRKPINICKPSGDIMEMALALGQVQTTYNL